MEDMAMSVTLKMLLLEKASVVVVVATSPGRIKNLSFSVVEVEVRRHKHVKAWVMHWNSSFRDL